MRATIVGATETFAPEDEPPATLPAPEEGVILRADVAGDAERLSRMFSRCSTETIRLRFHLRFQRVPQTMLGRLAGVNPDLGMALFAAVGDEVVGHAMYARETEGDLEAEVAVIVEDGWLSRGVGRQLLSEISAEARRDGVETLTCTTVGENHRVRDVARRGFPGARISFSGGACLMRLPLKSGGVDVPEMGDASEGRA